MTALCWLSIPDRETVRSTTGCFATPAGRSTKTGRWPAPAEFDQAVLQRLLSDAYFRLGGPKSLDRLDFARVLAESGLSSLNAADGAATLVRFTVESIAMRAYSRRDRKQWLVCGGGRRNPVLMQGLRQSLDAPAEPVETVGWNGDALEAQCFGFLAARVMNGLPLAIHDHRCTKPMPGGRIMTPEPQNPDQPAAA